jgi:hypothetical protein
MVHIEKLTREELENEILFNNDGLYEQFDEKRLLNHEYTREELIEITTNWIIEGNEATCE